MRIAMIGQKGIPTHYGGIERHVEALATRLGEAGHEVTVYTRDWYAPAKDDFSRGVRTVATRTVRTKHLDAIVHTLTSTVHAIRDGAEVFHFHGVGPSLLSWIPRVFAPRAAVIATFHCVDRNHQKWGWFARLALGLGERAACTFPHRTVAVSKTLQAYCMHSFGRDVRYVPNGVDDVARAGAGALRRFGLRKNGYVLMVSRLVRHKGAHHLIAAWKLLEKRGLTRGKKLVIVGGSAFTDGYVSRLHRFAEGLPNVVFTGYLNGQTLHETFAGALAVVHPSESEGLPIAVLEAMNYGKAVLASDIPENMEVVREHGVSFRNRDVIDLADKLAGLLRSPRRAAELGRRAQKFVERHYRWDDVAREVAALYAEVAGDAPEWTPAPEGVTVRRAVPRKAPRKPATRAKKQVRQKAHA